MSLERSQQPVFDKPYMIAHRLVEPRLNQITSNGQARHVEHQAMRVLSLLAAQPGDVVSREEILNEVWTGNVPNDEALTQAICKLRKALGDRPGDERVIQTIRKIGYRLVAPVSLVPASGNASRLSTLIDYSDGQPKRHIRIRVNGRWALAAALSLLLLFVVALLV